MTDVTVYGNHIESVCGVRIDNSDNVQVVFIGEKFDVTLFLTLELVKELGIEYTERTSAKTT